MAELPNPPPLLTICKEGLSTVGYTQLVGNWDHRQSYTAQQSQIHAYTCIHMHYCIEYVELLLELGLWVYPQMLSWPKRRTWQKSIFSDYSSNHGWDAHSWNFMVEAESISNFTLQTTDFVQGQLQLLTDSPDSPCLRCLFSRSRWCNASLNDAQKVESRRRWPESPGGIESPNILWATGCTQRVPLLPHELQWTPCV